MTRIKKPKLNSSQAGFTIAELAIASAVFSVVMLIAVAGFLELGRIFYKGITLTSTQETANQVYQDISGYFQTADTITPILNTPPPVYNYFCVGGARYTYTINVKVDSSATPNHSADNANFGLLKDILPGNGCAPPCNDAPFVVCPSGTIRLKTPQELLGDRMRLLKFQIQPNPTVTNFYKISMTLAYGDDEVLPYGIAGDPSSRYCASGGAGGQFCSVVDIENSLSKGFKKE